MKIPELELRQNFRDINVTILEQKVETRPRFERAEMRQENFENKYFQNVTNFLTLNFGQWTFPHILQFWIEISDAHFPRL